MTPPNKLSTETYSFDVAISFAGDNKRSRVREVATLLQDHFGDRRVFFDEFFKDEFPVLNFDTYLQDIYRTKSKMVVCMFCEKYDEKIWTQDEWNAIRDFERNECRQGDASQLRFYALKFGDCEISGIFSNAHVPDVNGETADEIANRIIRRYELYLKRSGIPANSELGTTAIGPTSILELIGVLRQHPIESVKPLVAIANALLRETITPDLETSSGNPIAAVVNGLVGDPISTEGSSHPLVRFAVLLHELCSIEPEIQTGIREWFDKTCGANGYAFEAVLGELPDVPSPANRYVWLDVSWGNSVPGVDVRPAKSHLRCGKLQYSFESEASTADANSQFSKIVSSYFAKHQSASPVNHVSVVTEVESLQNEWEYAPTGPLLDIPITVRSSAATDGRQAVVEIESACLCEYGEPEDYAVHVQKRGFFATGKTNGANSFPCPAMNAFLVHATIGLWTRGPEDDDDNEARLHDAVLNQRANDLPKIIHGRRAGAISDDSIWRRVILYFNPNIPPLQAEPEDDFLFNNSQLA